MMRHDITQLTDFEYLQLRKQLQFDAYIECVDEWEIDAANYLYDQLFRTNQLLFALPILGGGHIDDEELNHENFSIR